MYIPHIYQNIKIKIKLYKYIDIYLYLCIYRMRYREVYFNESCKHLERSHV